MTECQDCRERRIDQQQVVVNAIDVYDVVHLLHAFGIYDLSQAIRLQSALDDLGGDWPND